jgi:hypothetical protein
MLLRMQRPAEVVEFGGTGEEAGHYEFLAFAVESYGRLGACDQPFLRPLGEVAVAHGAISKAAFGAPIRR